MIGDGKGEGEKKSSPFGGFCSSQGLEEAAQSGVFAWHCHQSHAQRFPRYPLARYPVPRSPLPRYDVVVVDLPLGIPGCFPVGRQDDGFGFRRGRRRQVQEVIAHHELWLKKKNQHGSDGKRGATPPKTLPPAAGEQEEVMEGALWDVTAPWGHQMWVETPPVPPRAVTCWMGWGCPAATMVVTAVGGCTMTPWG